MIPSWQGTDETRRYHPALMTPAPPQPVLAQARAIYRDAATLYRAHVGAVIGSAAIVLVPFALLDGAGLLTADSSDTHPVAAVILVMVAVGTSGLSVSRRSSTRGPSITPRWPGAKPPPLHRAAGSCAPSRGAT